MDQSSEPKSFFGKLIGLPLHWQILIAMALGILVALPFRFLGLLEVDGAAGVALTAAYDIIVALGTLFVRLLKMMIVPLVASSIIVGVSSVGDGGSLGRMGLKTFGFYMMTSMLAIFVGLALSNVISPGSGVDPTTFGDVPAQVAPEAGDLSGIFFRMIPTNPLEALAATDMLAIIFFSILFGIALTHVTAEYRDRLLPVIDSFFHAMMKLTGGIIALAPIGVFGLIFKAVSELNLDFFTAVAFYILTLLLGLSFHLFVTLPLIYTFFTKRNPVHQYRAMTTALLTAFSTSSSSATLPVTMECVEENAGVSNRVSSFVLPLGATINMDGTALYECAGVLFIAQVLGADLSFAQQITVVITALLASIGAAGIPSAGLVMIFIVLEAVGLSGDQVGVIVGAMLAIDRPLDMYRTAVNIFSDSVCAVAVAHSEGELREEDLPDPIV